MTETETEIDDKRICPTCGIDEQIALKRGEDPFAQDTGMCHTCSRNPGRLLDGFLQTLGIELDEKKKGVALNRLIGLLYYITKG